MAPIAKDDFVLTIEDGEDDIGVSEEEEVEIPATSKKRKREEPAVNGKSKKKAAKSRQNDIVEEGQPPAEEELGWADGGQDDGALDSDFEFQIGESTGVIEDFDGWEQSNAKGNGVKSGDKKGVDIDDIIARRQAKQSGVNGDGAVEKKVGIQADEFSGFDEEDEDDELLAEDGFGMGVENDSGDEEGEGSDQDNSEADEAVDSDNNSVAAPVAHPDDFASASEDGDDGDGEDVVEAERRKAFFASESNIDDMRPSTSQVGGSFQTMGLSRPILKGLATVGFSDPTPIQNKTIPIALLGKDVVGGAVTGSGKTAAFIIPILERLLYRPKKVPTTRVAILMPTRELAVQCFNVARKLASFTDITFAQIVGGFSLREQETVLKQRPDVIIATPGRFIDHMRNSASFAVDTLEILVLDEADRMLEDGFADELNEILTTIPKSRQTMLFSATMTSSVDKLIRAGLNKPVRLMVDAKKQTVSGLVQEFVRLRLGRENKRLACLLYLCKTTFTDRTIVFFRQKKDAHRIRVVFGLCHLKAAELHGSMSQEQRIAAVESFRDGRVAFLLATDLASRGLDIKNVSTVLNYEAPQTHEIYLHRVGRTARAGRTGRSCTIAAEPDRKVVKAAVKSARAQGAKIVSRVLPVEEIDAWDQKLLELEDEIREVLDEEREQKLLGTAEREMRKGKNILVHEDEIMSRPKRTWFETEREKKEAKEAGKRELNGLEIKKGGKLSNKEKKKLDLRDERKEGRVWKKGKGDVAVNPGKPLKSKPGGKNIKKGGRSNGKAGGYSSGAGARKVKGGLARRK